MTEIPRPGKNLPILDWCLRAWEYMRAATPRAGAGISIQETSSGSIISLARIPTRDHPRGPFWPEFQNVWDSETSMYPASYRVRVSRGVIFDHNTLGGSHAEVMAYFTCSNQTEAGHPEELAWFTIEAGQAVYVKVPVTSAGSIDYANCQIVVDADNKASVHVIPAAGEAGGGASATCYYKLAKFELEETGAHKISYYLAGDNIHHTKSLSARPAAYEDGPDSIALTETGPDLQFSTIGGNLDLQIYGVVGCTLYFRDGLFKGVTDPGGTPPGLITKIILGT